MTPEVALAAKRVSGIYGDDSPVTLSEIVQDVFVKLCEDDRRILREFEDRGSNSFLRLLRLVAVSVATDHFRHILAEKRGGGGDSVPLELRIAAEVTDVKATAAVGWPTLVAQLDGLLRLYPDIVSIRDRNVFWLYYRQGMTAEAISKIPAIELSAKGVESLLQRLTRLLRVTIVSGKPQSGNGKKKGHSIKREKAISTVIAIDIVKDK